MSPAFNETLDRSYRHYTLSSFFFHHVARAVDNNVTTLFVVLNNVKCIINCSACGYNQRSYSYANIFISAPYPRDLNEVTPSGGRRARKP